MVITQTADPSTSEQRTALEQQVARALDTLGIVYREQVWMGGRYQVDFLIPTYSIVIEANSCYWHGHWRCGNLYLPRLVRDERRAAFLVARCDVRHVVPIWACDTRRYGALDIVRRSLRAAGVPLGMED